MHALMKLLTIVLIIATPAANAADAKEAAAYAADDAFVAALAKGDDKAAAAMLRRDFSWITGDGDKLNHTQSVAALKTAANNTTPATDVQRHYYGKLASVRGAYGNNRFLRVWTEQIGTNKKSE